MNFRFTQLLTVLVVAGFTFWACPVQGQTNYEVRVESEYGKLKVSPTDGLQSYPANTEVNFTTPEFVYLNRNFEELDDVGDANNPNDLEVAYYRARNIGYAIDGTPVQGSERFVRQTLTGNITLIWKWELEYGVFIDYTDRAGGAFAGGDGAGNPNPAVGRTWVAKDTQFSASVDRTVSSEPLGGDSSGVRYSATSYRMDNIKGVESDFPGSPLDTFRQYEEVTTFGVSVFTSTYGPSKPMNVEKDGFTIAFWGKIDRSLTTRRDQVFLVTRPGSSEFGAPGANGEAFELDRTIFGVRSNGEFYVDEVIPTKTRAEVPLPTVREALRRELASLPSALVGFDWHHWAVVFDFPRTDPSMRQIRVYRDGQVVFDKHMPVPKQADGMTPVPVSSPLYRPSVLANTQDQINLAFSLYRATGGTKFEQLEGALNNLSWWPEALPPDFGDASTVTALVNQAKDPLGADFKFTANSTEVLPIFPPEARSVLRTSGLSVPLSDVGNRVVTETVTISDWLRVHWEWAKQVRYRFYAADQANVNLDNQSFVRVRNFLGTGWEPTVFGFGNNTDVWIDEGRQVEFGAFYRTLDRCLTLGAFPGAASTRGDLGSVSVDALPDVSTLDSQSNSRVARVATIGSAANPTTVRWSYQPTVFRAEVPLGQSFDAFNPDLQLVPALCDGAVLKLDGAGSGDAMPITDLKPPTDGSTNKTPRALRWDALGKALFPVHPGSYAVNWLDASDANKTYKIEIVSGYPGESTTLSSPRENLDGSRQIQSSNYVTSVTLPGIDISGGFPAQAENAHYRHWLDASQGRIPPMRLDPSLADSWKFQEMSFADASTNAAVAKTGSIVSFTAANEGRSVLVYSYRPNPDEIANGNLSSGSIPNENLAVRVVSSKKRGVIPRTDSQLVLGQRGLALGGLSPLGVIQRSGSPVVTSVDPGNQFVVDFWLNAKSLNDSSPVKVFSTKDDALKVTLQPIPETVTACYRGIEVTHAMPIAGTDWRHLAVHVFTYNFFSVDVTVLDFYLDGVRQEQALPTSQLNAGSASSTVGTTVTDNSLRFGVGADASDGLLLDQFRLFALGSDAGRYLNAGEVRRLRSVRDMSVASAGLRNVAPALWFSFEPAPSSGSFANQGTSPNVGLGAITTNAANDYGGVWPHIDVQEVATRRDSVLDNAGFGGGGYILNAVSNYNASIYNRAAEVGTWGPIFPVNRSSVFANNEKLEVVYYENPYLSDPATHPNVAWAYVATEYQNVEYPILGPYKDKRIYIASRIGTEGVDKNGRPQQVYDLAGYSDLTIYNQPSPILAGFNPNEEHALTAASGRAALKVKNLGEDTANNPPLAAFALQSDVNGAGKDYTSDPWVLIQVNNLVSGEPEMAAYMVEKTRPGSVAFPRPDLSTPFAGLAYEAAANPEDGFLTLNPSGTFPFAYSFDYPVFAGDLVVPPYPLNLVIGNVKMPDERGGNIQLPGGVNQRTFWRDVNRNAWVVSGGGKFFQQYFYPFRSDFYYSTPLAAGQSIAWLPEAGQTFLGDGVDSALDDVPQPEKIRYTSSWRSDYPKLKRGETLAYQGGEYFNENPGSNGLPAIVAMKAAEIVYDSAVPTMLFTPANATELAKASARVIRPLDRREVDFTTAQMQAVGLEPSATNDIFVIGERWYFKQLPGSLGKRFYFDSLTQKLVFRGQLNDKESDDPELTSGPDPINLLQPNVMTSGNFSRMTLLRGFGPWETAIGNLFKLSQNPHGLSVAGLSPSIGSPVYLQGFRSPGPIGRELVRFWVPDAAGNLTATNAPNPQVLPLNSFGVGCALVPNASLLTQTPTGSLYVTVAENNRTELNGAAVSLHIIEIIPDRYRGAIQVVESPDAFSEKISLLHSGDFGANTDALYYEWWIRDAAPLDTVANEIQSNGTLTETDGSGATLWQRYAQGTGLHSIVFEGRPDVVLADKLVLMRYRQKDETSGWRLVPFNFGDAASSWSPGNAAIDAPFQWAGAANSPQLQADGSKRYIPQLIMGWVKRVLDRINPYEARYSDFFNNESPASYTSQIQIAGGPFAGKVALNSDKDVIERTGLIELYETVLARARELSIDNASAGPATDGIHQALLLAATRLSVLYELLAAEAYSDAQDPSITIGVGEDATLVSAASYTHAFQGLESDLLHEELALLRGTDFLKSYPVYNRMFWNYTKGLGEAAYNSQYNIYDWTGDGFINEDDARALYPQGHGDAWGHYSRAIGMHYTLLQHPGFSWKTRSELYALMDNVLEVDFLDEKTFARLAAGKARAGRDIVRATYRQAYTQDPDGQWQGYTDGADPARAWGVSEWAHRAGHGAYFDWAVANALLPEKADLDPSTAVGDPENLDRIERLGAEDEIGAIAAGLWEIQTAMSEANNGSNPLGFDADAIAMDIELQFYDNSSGGDRRSHFEQIYTRAVASAGNALATLDFAAQADSKLRRIADDTDALVVESLRQDLDYRSRLIEIFGQPYSGQIGFGKAFPEGYEGPDTALYAYLDKTTIDQIVPSISTTPGVVTFNTVNAQVKAFMGNQDVRDLYYDNADGVYNSTEGQGHLTRAFETLNGNNLYQFETPEGVALTLPYNTASKYAFQAPVDGSWGSRISTGRVQSALQEMLLLEISLDEAIIDYIGFLQDWEEKLHRLQSEVALIEQRYDLNQEILATRLSINSTLVAIDGAIAAFQAFKDFAKPTADSIANSLPEVSGPFAYDITSLARGVAYAAGEAASGAFNAVKSANDIAKTVIELVRDEIISSYERRLANADQISSFEGLIEELANLSGADQPKRDTIGALSLELDMKAREYTNALAEGFRLQREREAFNKVLAATTQKGRYQDMIIRLTRNEAMAKYQSAFNHAARYAWLAARAYDYETSLDPGHPAAATQILDRIVKERQLGLWTDDEPQTGQGGLAEILHDLNANFGVLKGQLGINNPQSEVEKISMRSELFRIGPTASDGGTPASDARWEDAIKARIVDDLTVMPEFRRYCRPFSTPEQGAQPGIVIRFGSHINLGVNFFGNALVAGDHAYSNANFATKIRGFGAWLENYNAAGLATTPRAYIVPVGDDYLRTSSAPQPTIRSWNVMEQRIPTPFVINQSQISAPGYIPSLNGVEGGFGQLRRHGDFRMYHDNGDPTADDSELTMDSRLIGRSVWNSDWLLIIPGANLHVDPMTGLKKLAETITDIKLHFLTYSHQGQ